MNHSDETVDDCFAFFMREKLLEQQCLLLENELVVMGVMAFCFHSGYAHSQQGRRAMS